MRILVIDDNKDVLNSLRQIVELWGGYASTAICADEAADLCRSQVFDFILLDIRMPEHDAVWFMTHVRIPARTRVVAMSAYAPKSTVDGLFELGVIDYIEKPFGPEALMDLLNRHAREVATEKHVSAPWEVLRPKRNVKRQRAACLAKRFRHAPACHA